MQSDCEIYVDPEEDEVFFGCVSEREKTVCAKLVNCTGSIPSPGCKFNEVLDRQNVLNEDEKNVENILKKEKSSKVVEEIVIDDSVDSIEDSFERSQDSCKILSNNTSVELEHNYSTPMKHKIDKTILTTPKSVVKADKDGGFLKVLSEIALVKAEAEGDKKSEETREDEDKENKKVATVPEIKITEATPEKRVISSPPKNFNRESRRFRIIYNSPKKEENVDCKTKSTVESFENENNLKNKCLGKNTEKDNRKSIELIDFGECGSSTEETERKENKPIEESSEKKEVKTEEPSIPGPRQLQKIQDKPANIRFSVEARKIVEVLKKSAVDDTLNFTIPEMDVEEEENIFLSPGPLSGLDETVIPKTPVQKTSPKILTKPADNKLESKSQTAEKDRRKFTPAPSQSRLQPMKYFSEKKIYNQTEAKKCAKKLPLEEKRPLEKNIGGRTGESNLPVPSSRIPLSGAVKSSKIPLNRAVVTKATPTKTPSGKGCKNPKFNHIESPINAYIHNKPTSLVVNVKPDIKKDSLRKTWKVQRSESEKKIQEKATKLQNPQSAISLPFVEYKSATPYKIERRPESRLPRLAPNVMKLLGTHSPKVLKHEGRFHVPSPRQRSAKDNTIVADLNEVSVVVSHRVQKTNTIK